MAVCRVVETGASPEEYDQVVERVMSSGGPPAGAVFHIAAVGEDGKIRVIDVWESREQAEQFGERIQSTRKELGLEPRMPSITTYEVHNIVRP